MRLNDKSTDFWRTISLHTGTGSVDADVSDNVHHFRVKVLHDGAAVTQVTAETIRVPWVTCPGATASLSHLVGTPLRNGCRPPLDQSQQCTHLLDLSLLAIAHVRRSGTRILDIRIRYDPDQALVVADLAINSAPFVQWLSRDGVVVSAGPFFGHDSAGRSRWSPEVEADTDLREAGLVLRRALMVFRSRNWSAKKRCAAEIDDLQGACYSFRPERSALAVRPENYQEWI